MRRLIHRALIILVVSAIASALYASQVTHALNSYQGPVKNLLPARIGEFTKNSETPSLPLGIVRAKNSLHLSGNLGYSYISGDKIISFVVIAFASPADAAKALQMLKGGPPEYLNAISGIKKKADIKVGERYEFVQLYPGRPEPQKINHIIWTNGSVLFLLDSSDSGPRRVSMAALKQLEDSLTY